jgi:hypothetical protein
MTQKEVEYTNLAQYARKICTIGAALVLPCSEELTSAEHDAPRAVVVPITQKESRRDTWKGDADAYRRVSAWSRRVHLSARCVRLRLRAGRVDRRAGQGGKQITITPGQTFYEGPNDVHTVGRNASTMKLAKSVVVSVMKKGVDAVLPSK